MPVLIDANNPRSIAAIEIAAGAADWLVVDSNAWRIPSQRRWGVRYLVTLNTCTTCSLLPRRRRNGRPFSPSLTPADYPAGCLPCPVAPCDGH